MTHGNVTWSREEAEQHHGGRTGPCFTEGHRGNPQPLSSQPLPTLSGLKWQLERELQKVLEDWCMVSACNCRWDSGQSSPGSPGSILDWVAGTGLGALVSAQAALSPAPQQVLHLFSLVSPRSSGEE